MTITSFREIPLWRLEVQPERVPNFLDDESIDGDQKDNQTKLLENNEISDKIPKTSSYGAMGNDEMLDVPPAHVCLLLLQIKK